MSLIGRVLANRYEIIEEIGSGGMAIVYKAKCQLLNRFVAVKVLRKDLQNDDEFVRRFNVEAQAAASLAHPNIVSIYDVGCEDGLHYIVMEYIEGETLKEYIDKKRILPWREAVAHTIQIGRGLEQAHKNSIVHRDIKPHNIIMTHDGVLKVTDFGIARANVQTTMTCEDSAIGSVHYISPEQARGGYTDARSDIYSLGIVLYEMLTGLVPFDNESPVTIAIKHIQEEPVPPRRHNISIPLAVEKAVLKAMTKEISMRYKTVTEFIADLQEILNDPTRIVNEVVGTDKVDEKEHTRIMPAVPKDDELIAMPVKDEPISMPVKTERDEFEVPQSRKKSRKKTSSEIDRKKMKMVRIAAIICAALVLFSIYFFAIKPIMDDMNKNNKEVLMVEIPDIVNLDYNVAVEKYQAEGFRIVLGDPEHDEEYGTIIKQEPAAKTKVKKSGEEIVITVYLSAGPGEIVMDDYTTLDRRIAEEKLTKLGLNVEIIEEYNDTYKYGEVIRQEPLEYKKIRKGDTVILYISKGSEEVEVGDYTTLDSSTAKEKLIDLGLKVEIVEEYSDTVEPGIVISQEPEEYGSVKRGGTVTLHVSKGPEETEPEDNPDDNNDVNPPENPENVDNQVDTDESGNTGESQNQDNPSNNTDQPSSTTEKKSRIITLFGPKDKDSALVQVKVNGKIVYEEILSRDESDTVKLESTSDSVEMEVFFDGVSKQKATVPLS